MLSDLSKESSQASVESLNLSLGLISRSGMSVKSDCGCGAALAKLERLIVAIQSTDQCSLASKQVSLRKGCDLHDQLSNFALERGDSGLNCGESAPIAGELLIEIFLTRCKGRQPGREIFPLLLEPGSSGKELFGDGELRHRLGPIGMLIEPGPGFGKLCRILLVLAGKLCVGLGLFVVLVQLFSEGSSSGLDLLLRFLHLKVQPFGFLPARRQRVDD